MNSIIENELPGNQILRDDLMTMLSDDDLAYKLPGDNPTLGELCVELGQTQQIYSHSFRTLELDWGYRGSMPEVPNSVASIKAWYETLDAELHEALSGLTEEGIHNREIDRGYGFIASPHIQFEVYREAVLVFYAKAVVYLRALQKPISEEWKRWVG
jgi:hypothetical protein